MGLFWHELKAAKSTEQPRNWVLFDCETRTKRIDANTKELVLRLGCATYRRDARKGNPAIVRKLRFTKPSQFWDWVIEQSEPDRQLWIVGYNAGVDWRWVDGFRQLADRGYTLEPPWIKHPITIIRHHKGKHKITLIDAMNWVEGKLEKWGARMKIPKLKMPRPSEPDSKWFPYCERDVDILDRVVTTWREWVIEHDMGPLAATKAGQAMNAYRHRFMKHSIMIHAHDEATEAERASYHGGRVECWRIGTFTNGPFYKLDINSMYPAVMRDDPMPIELYAPARDVSVARIKKGLKKYLMVANCDIVTDDPAYGIQSERGLIYPVGSFRTWLTTPAIKYAIAHGHLKHAETVFCYEGARIYTDWVNEMYELRMKERASGNEDREEITKKMLNSLYGKTAQLSEPCEEVENVNAEPDGSYSVVDGEDGGRMRYAIICGRRFDYEEKGEAAHSFTAIASHVTAGAAIRLWEYAKLAGADHRYYCDTDCLIVDKVGYKRLRKYIDNQKLGFLKVQEISPWLVVHTLKDYATKEATKRKGISAKARLMKDGSFKQEQWQGLRGAIAAARTDRVVITNVRKRLTRKYTKGTVQRDGFVLPLVVEDGRVVG